MLEIIVVIFVVRSFMRLAHDKGYKRAIWGLIGAASFFVPILLAGFILGIVLAMQGKENEVDQYRMLAVVIELVGGILASFIAYKLLSRLPDKHEAFSDPEILEGAPPVEQNIEG